MTASSSPSPEPADPTARRAARLAAVQAVYQMELTGNPADDTIGEFLDHRFATPSEIPAGPPDRDFFADIVRGVTRFQVEIDRALARSLAANWKLERIDSIARAVLRCAGYELIARADVPGKVVIDEYLYVAHAFLNADETGFVNAVLDRMARRKRAREFGEDPPSGELPF
ncbi:MAG: transcription antitermination factor NusB [Alphaproteobacteria bacterium]|nr:transcription antitermination factor NusB [Alphaproteobacteria bacterium]